MELHFRYTHRNISVLYEIRLMMNPIQIDQSHHFLIHDMYSVFQWIQLGVFWTKFQVTEFQNRYLWINDISGDLRLSYGNDITSQGVIIGLGITLAHSRYKSLY